MWRQKGAQLRKKLKWGDERRIKKRGDSSLKGLCGGFSLKESSGWAILRGSYARCSISIKGASSKDFQNW